MNYTFMIIMMFIMILYGMARLKWNVGSSAAPPRPKFLDDVRNVAWHGGKVWVNEVATDIDAKEIVKAMGWHPETRSFTVDSTAGQSHFCLEYHVDGSTTFNSWDQSDNSWDQSDNKRFYAIVDQDYLACATLPISSVTDYSVIMNDKENTNK